MAGKAPPNHEMVFEVSREDLRGANSTANAHRSPEWQFEDQSWELLVWVDRNDEGHHNIMVALEFMEPLKRSQATEKIAARLKLCSIESSVDPKPEHLEHTFEFEAAFSAGQSVSVLLIG